MDFLNEWLVKKKKDAKDITIYSATLIGAFLLLYLIMMQISANVLATLVPLEFAGIIFGAYKIISALNVEFEYSVINGDMDVDKISAQRRRKRLVSVKIRNIEYFAKLDESNKKMTEKTNYQKVIVAASSVDSPNAYIAVFYNNNEKTCLIFEPTEKMVENFANYIPRALNHTL